MACSRHVDYFSRCPPQPCFISHIRPVRTFRGHAATALGQVCRREMSKSSPVLLHLFHHTAPRLCYTLSLVYMGQTYRSRWCCAASVADLETSESSSLIPGPRVRGREEAVSTTLSTSPASAWLPPHTSAALYICRAAPSFRRKRPRRVILMFKFVPPKIEVSVADPAPEVLRSSHLFDY